MPYLLFWSVTPTDFYHHFILKTYWWILLLTWSAYICLCQTYLSHSSDSAVNCSRIGVIHYTSYGGPKDLIPKVCTFIGCYRCCCQDGVKELGKIWVIQSSAQFLILSVPGASWIRKRGHSGKLSPNIFGNIFDYARSPSPTLLSLCLWGTTLRLQLLRTLTLQ